MQPWRKKQTNQKWQLRFPWPIHVWLVAMMTHPLLRAVSLINPPSFLLWFTWCVVTLIPASKCASISFAIQKSGRKMTKHHLRVLKIVDQPYYCLKCLTRIRVKIIIMNYYEQFSFQSILLLCYFIISAVFSVCVNQKQAITFLAIKHSTIKYIRRQFYYNIYKYMDICQTTVPCQSLIIHALLIIIVLVLGLHFSRQSTSLSLPFFPVFYLCLFHIRVF